MLKTAFIIESERSAAARYRVLLNLHAFEAAGIDLYPVVLPASARARGQMFRDLALFDVVVLQRRLLQPWQFQRLRRYAKVLGYDFDDAVIVRDGARGSFNSISRWVKFRYMMRGMDFATAGNPFLAEMSGLPPERAFVAPTPVDTDRFVPVERAPGPVRIGWVGSKSTVKYLDPVLPAIERVAAARPGVTLTVVSDAFPPPRPFIRNVQWREDAEPAEVAAFDIGIMPLPDDPWTRGKCGFKLLLYGACGVPSVASPVGSNRAIVADGQTGLFADGADGWERSLLALIDDEAGRRAMGRAARRGIEENYASSVVIPKWAGILKEMAAARKGRT